MLASPGSIGSMEQHILGSAQEVGLLSNSVACGSFGAVGALGGGGGSTSWVPSSDFASRSGLCVGSHLELSSLTGSMHNGSLAGGSVHGGSMHGSNAALLAAGRSMGAFSNGAAAGADVLRSMGSMETTARPPTSVEDLIR